MKILSFVPFCLLSFQIFAQSNISSEQPSVTHSFEDNFDDNRNNWINDSENDSAVTATIDNGVLKIINKKSKGNWAYNIPNEDIDYSKDFEIQVSFVIREDASKHKAAVAFYWGADGNSTYSWISLSRRRIGITNCYGGDHKRDAMKFSTIRPALKKGIPYIVTIRKRKDKYGVILNHKVFAELDYMPLKGSEIAIAAWNNTIIEFDNFKIYNLEYPQ